MNFLLPALTAFKSEKSNLLCFQLYSSHGTPIFNSFFIWGKPVSLIAFDFKEILLEYLKICPRKTKKLETDLPAIVGRSGWR